MSVMTVSVAVPLPARILVTSRSRMLWSRRRLSAVTLWLRWLPHPPRLMRLRRRPLRPARSVSAASVRAARRPLSCRLSRRFRVLPRLPASRLTPRLLSVRTRSLRSPRATGSVSRAVSPWNSWQARSTAWRRSPLRIPRRTLLRAVLIRIVLRSVVRPSVARRSLLVTVSAAS